MPEPILKVENLGVGFHTYRGDIHAVRDVSFTLEQGEILGIVGESGCGKSVTANAIMGLLPKENSFVEEGSIKFEGRELLDLKENEMGKLRGNDIAMVFQDPMTSLNPVMRISTQLVEGIMLHKKISRTEAKQKAVALLDKLGIPDPQEKIRCYPHQLSGGMRQRVVIAMALICQPKILLADEPTTALDVTIQAQILDLLKQYRQEFNFSIIIISHDLGIIADLCDRVIIMYAGKMVERGTIYDVFYHPHHPYTKGLLSSLPRLNNSRNKELTTIAGQPPDLLYDITGCSFFPRCRYAMAGCQGLVPEEKEITPTHSVRCHLMKKIEKYKVNTGKKKGD